jgi:hypothetical protein
MAGPHRAVLLLIALVFTGTAPFLAFQAPASAPRSTEPVPAAAQPSPNTSGPATSSGGGPEISSPAPPSGNAPASPSTPNAPSTSPSCPSAAPAVVEEVERLRRSAVGMQYMDARALLRAPQKLVVPVVRYVGGSGVRSETPEVPDGVDDELVVVTAAAADIKCVKSATGATGVLTELTLTLGAVMPHVVGTTRIAAMRELGARGLDRHVTWRPSTAEQQQPVLGQTPPPGTLVAFSDPVGLDFEKALLPPAPSSTSAGAGGVIPPTSDSGFLDRAGAAGVGGAALVLLVLALLSVFLLVRRGGRRPRWIRQHVRLVPASEADWSSGPARFRAIARQEPHHPPGPA